MNPAAEFPEEPEQCACCGYPAKVLTEYRGPCTTNDVMGENGRIKLCEVCAATFLSNCVVYPSLYGEHRDLFSSIGWIANKILDEIRSLAVPRGTAG